MRTGPNFIPNISGKKGWIFGRDNSWMNIDNQTVLLRKKEEQDRKKIIAERIYQQQLRLEEMVNTIIADATLSQLYGNPSYYPPVPTYIQPQGRKLSTQEIELMHGGTNTNTTDIIISENFGDTCLWVSNTPITLGDWELYNVASFPYVSSGNFHTHLQSLKTIHGYTTQELYSYPNIVERVKWFVTFCCSDKGNEVLGIYCYRNKEAIEELTEFLVRNPVSNEKDKNEAIITLSQVYHQIS